MTEPHDAYADAPLDPLNERLQQEVGEPLGRSLPAFRVLQFLPHSPLDPRYARDAGRYHGSRVGHRGTTHGVRQLTQFTDLEDDPTAWMIQTRITGIRKNPHSYQTCHRAINALLGHYR